LVAAVAVERWGQRAGQLATLLDKHPVAVSRWVSVVQLAKRNVDPGYSKELDALDKALSDWVLDAYAKGKFAIDLSTDE
jgi:hypothetical protein